MEIKLKKAERTEIIQDGLENNEELLNYISHKSSNIEIKLIVPDYIDKYTGRTFEYEDERIPLLCMLNDVINEESFVYNKLKDQFNKSDIVKNKYDMFMYLLNCYINCAFNEFDIKDTTQFASFYKGMMYFKYRLPDEIADRITVERIKELFIQDIDLYLLSDEELCTYVIPQYYREIGWFDRKSLRDDKETMNYLSIHWFDKARFGKLD